jgi:hypothetical protein
MLLVAVLVVAVAVATVGGPGGQPREVPADMQRLDLAAAPPDARPRLSEGDAMSIAAAAAEGMAAEPGVTSSAYLMQDASGELVWVVRYAGLSIHRPGPPASGGASTDGQGRTLNYAYVLIDDATGESPYILLKP